MYTAPGFAETLEPQCHYFNRGHAHKRFDAAGPGHFYAKSLLESVGVTDSEDGVLRISFAHYNSADDVVRVIDALRALHQARAPGTDDMQKPR
ncbi:MAG: hypothetical protein OXU96_02835 [Gammaproteobacteria bacterium]|nr:hypothetical protein [Gammaproteobacteria bacterium]